MSDELPHDWYQFTIEHWQAVLKDKGFENADIQFSGFWSQGDGASFTASVNRDLPPEILQSIEDYRIAGPVAAKLTQKRWRDPSYEICIYIRRHRDHYVHEYTLYCDVEARCFDLPPDIEQAVATWAEALETSLLEEARDLSRQIYRDLETEYNYQTADLEAAA